MTPEGRVKKHLKDRVTATGGRIRYLRWLGRRGAADTFVWWPVEFAYQQPVCAFVEVKKGNSPYQPGQEREIERMRADGFHVYTVRSFDDVDAMIEQLQAAKVYVK